MLTLKLHDDIPVFPDKYKYITCHKFIFPGGEPHIKIDFDSNDIQPVLIQAMLKDSESLVWLFLATNALRQAGFNDISLHMPYVPFARQDRVMTPGEPLSIKWFATLINSQKYKNIIILDPHSDVTTALLNNVIAKNNSQLVADALKKFGISDSVLVSPDAGQEKKIYKVAKTYQLPVLSCSKHRDVTNGRITDIIVPRTISLANKHLYIIDDICDGGATFKMLADKLKLFEPKSINLVVTHGIFSKGYDFAESVDTIYTTNSFHSFINSPGKVNVTNVW